MKTIYQLTEHSFNPVPFLQQPIGIRERQVFGRRFGVIYVGRRNRRCYNHPWPTDAHMHSQALEDLPGNLVISEGSQTSKNSTMAGSGETTNRHRKAVDHRNQRVMRLVLAQMSVVFLYCQGARKTCTSG